jgi:hypothetical protein
LRFDVGKVVCGRHVLSAVYLFLSMYSENEHKTIKVQKSSY